MAKTAFGTPFGNIVVFNYRNSVTRLSAFLRSPYSRHQRTLNYFFSSLNYVPSALCYLKLQFSHSSQNEKKFHLYYCRSNILDLCLLKSPLKLFINIYTQQDMSFTRRGRVYHWHFYHILTLVYSITEETHADICFIRMTKRGLFSWYWRHLYVSPPKEHKWEPIKIRVKFSLLYYVYTPVALSSSLAHVDRKKIIHRFAIFLWNHEDFLKPSQSGWVKNNSLFSLLQVLQRAKLK